MWGFIIAIQCALALLFIWGIRRVRRGPWGGMYRAFARLQTTPGQEQVIRTALSDVRSAGRRVRDDARRAGPDLSTILQADEFDESAAKSWLASRERSISEVMPSVLSGLKNIHDVLDPDQRKKLADMLAHPHLRGCGFRHGRLQEGN